MISVVGAQGGILAAPVGVALDDDFIGGGLQPVERGLGDLGFGALGQPPGRLAVGGQQRGPGEVALHGDLIEIAGGGGIKAWRAKPVVEDERSTPMRWRNPYFAAVVENGDWVRRDQRPLTRVSELQKWDRGP